LSKGPKENHTKPLSIFPPYEAVTSIHDPLNTTQVAALSRVIRPGIISDRVNTIR